MTIMIKPKTILIAITGIGMLVTAYFAAKNTPEAQKRKEEALQEKREQTGDENAQLTFVESAKAQVGAYIPTIAAGVATLGSLAGAEVINERTLKKAESKIRDYQEYKTMTEKLVGKETSKFVEKAVEQKKICESKKQPWEEPTQFRIVFQGHSILFESTRADVMTAIYELNRLFHERGSATFNKFLEYLGQDPIDEGWERGWEQYIGETTYGYSWIDIALKQCEDEPWITEIFMVVYPHFLEEDYVDEEIEEFPSKISSGDAFMKKIGSD